MTMLNIPVTMTDCNKVEFSELTIEIFGLYLD